MKNIKIGIISYLIYCLALGPVLADTASLLPNAVQQFFDNNGNPLTSGTVTTYKAGTSTLATTWKDSAETLPNTNPIKLDGGGKAIIYGNQTYRQVVKDRNNNLIWDAVTAPGGGGGGTPSTIGDGNLVGTILPWSGLVAPTQYVFGYGQEINRTTYSVFYTAVTQQLNVICSSASNILTGISDTSQIKIGETVELALCVVPGTTVTAKTTSTITLSNPASVSINAVATFFPWGNGDGSTTFNVPDLRGYAPIGRDNMGGSSAGRINTTNCGSSITPDALGAVCGTDSTTLVANNIPQLPVNFSSGAPAKYQVGVLVNVGAASSTLNDQGSITATVGTLSPIAISRIQPSVTLNYIVKIVPDTSAVSATGVFSIGGMTGVIACGTGILCTGNIISSTGTVPGGIARTVQFNDTGVFNGSPNFTFISPDNLVLGATGISSKFDIVGSTSGRVRQTVSAVAGTPTITWGNTSGTPVVTATSPLIISSTTGNINISPDALTRINDTNVILTLSAGSGTAVISPTTMTLGWTGLLSPTRGGTGVNNSTNTITVAGNFAVTTNGGTISFGAASKTLTVNKSITLDGTDGTTWTGPTINATLAALNIVDQTLTGGANVTLFAIGTVSSGTTTLDCGKSPLQTITNNGAFTLAPPANDGSCIVRFTNGASAGTITFSGWTVGSNTGDTYATTNTNKYDLFVRRIGGVASYQWSALQ